ncbi:MAG: Holliday junction helicase RuvB, holliday junction helicase RuvB [Parcubacteria group bacterium]|nr:Holliday junction helicase RuvB, holliday junction helicase RuvB [Parcubacteria group bacterium]
MKKKDLAQVQGTYEAKPSCDTMLAHPLFMSSSSDDTALPIKLRDQALDAALRPSLWDEYVGQGHVKDNVHIVLEAAKMRGDMPEHLLFYGPPGVGKTTLAHLIGKSLNAPVKTTSGVAIERAGDLAAILTNLEPGTVLFIDEIHQLSSKIEELLYPALESGSLDIILGKGPSARTVELSLPPFTLVGATTRVAQLSGPLRSRFGGGVYQLDFYSDEDLRAIVARSAKLLNMEIGADVIDKIARRSRATPRVANALLKRVRDFAQVHEKPLTAEVCDEACRLFGIDSLGLTKDDRRYMETLRDSFKSGPAGVRALASALHEDADTVENLYEPYLLRLGFIERSSRGRILTTKGKEYLG